MITIMYAKRPLQFPPLHATPHSHEAGRLEGWSIQSEILEITSKAGFAGGATMICVSWSVRDPGVPIAKQLTW